MKLLKFVKEFNNEIIKNKVSIISTCYEKDYKENELLIQSINNIDYINFDILLMIDDDFKEKYNEINYYFKKYINIKKQIFYSGENLGNYTHYNTLINYSDAEFIFITEPNTIWNKNLITECVNIFNSKPNIDVIQYKYNRYNCDNANNLDYYNKIFNSSTGWSWGDAMLVFRKTVFQEVGYFENARVGADSDLWKRIQKLIPSKIYYLDINGFISIGAGESKKYRKEREDYWNSEILRKENYCYLENNNLKLNFSFVENLAPVSPYNKEIISNKKKILIVSHCWDFIDNIIEDLDKSKYEINKLFTILSIDYIKLIDLFKLAHSHKNYINATKNEIKNIIDEFDLKYTEEPKIIFKEKSTIKKLLDPYVDFIEDDSIFTLKSEFETNSIDNLLKIMNIFFNFFKKDNVKLTLFYFPHVHVCNAIIDFKNKSTNDLKEILECIHNILNLIFTYLRHIILYKFDLLRVPLISDLYNKIQNDIKNFNEYDIILFEWFEVTTVIYSHFIKENNYKCIVRLHSYEYYFINDLDLNLWKELEIQIMNTELDKEILKDKLKLISKIKNRLNNYFLNSCNLNIIDKLIVVNDWFKEKISKKFEFNNIVTIPNYYKTYDSHKLDSNNRKKNIGIVGINPLVSKGLYDLLLIFKKLVKQDNEYKLYIKGDLIRKKEIPNYIDKQIGEKYYKNSIKLYDEMIKKYPNNIVLCKHTNDGGEDMETFYNNIGYLLTASIQESFHCVIMEAGSLGCIPILYENKKFHNLDVARTPQIFKFISFDEIDNIINYITNNKRFEQLSLSALEYYNSMNTVIKDFENLFDSYNENNDNINVTFFIPEYNENSLIKYEDQILENIGSNLNKNIEIIVVSNKINKSELIGLKKCWDNGHSYRDSSVQLNYKLKITLINLKRDININFKVLIGIKNSYKNSKMINILFNDEIVRIPHCNLEKYHKFVQSRINDNTYLTIVNSKTFKNLELEIPKVLAVIPVYGRETLLKYTVRRLYNKNYIHKVIVIGENDSERKVIESEGGIRIKHSNVWLGDKWNIGFQFSKKYEPDAILFVGSSDWISQDWIFSSYKYLKKGYGYVGKNDYHMIDISNSEINSNHWLGYPWEDRKNETIGIGRLISKEFLEKIEYNPFDINSNVGMDKTMYQKCISNGLKVKIIENDINRVTFLSLSCDLWVNKHIFKYHMYGAKKLNIENDQHYQEYKLLYENTKLHTKEQYKNLLNEFCEFNDFYKDYKKIKMC